MADSTHHHHHNNAPPTPSPTPRPLLLRILSVISLVLPVILYIISFATVLKTIYTPQFALSHPFDDNSYAIDNLTYKASPFYACYVSHEAYVDDALTFNNSCVRRPALGHKGLAACNQTNGLDAQQCQKVVVSAELFVSGASLIGIGLLLSLVVLGLGMRAALATTEGGAYAAVPAESKDQDQEAGGAGSSPSAVSAGPSVLSIVTPFLGSCTTLLAVLAAFCIALAQIIGVDALVDTLKPTSSQITDYQTRWYMGPGSLIYPSVAWLAAILGAFVAGTGCGALGH